MITYYDENNHMIGEEKIGHFELSIYVVAQGFIKFFNSKYALYVSGGSNREFHLYKVEKRGGEFRVECLL